MNEIEKGHLMRGERRAVRRGVMGQFKTLWLRTPVVWLLIAAVIVVGTLQFLQKIS